MEHSMKLLDIPFDGISSGKKKIEIRLYDEKRQKLNLGDVIEFTRLSNLESKLKVRVVALLRYNSFRDMVEDLGMSQFGYSDRYPVDDFLESIYKIYSKENEEKYGALGIKIELIK